MKLQKIETNEEIEYYYIKEKVKSIKYSMIFNKEKELYTMFKNNVEIKDEVLSHSENEIFVKLYNQHINYDDNNIKFIDDFFGITFLKYNPFLYFLFNPFIKNQNSLIFININIIFNYKKNIDIFENILKNNTLEIILDTNIISEILKDNSEYYVSIEYLHKLMVYCKYILKIKVTINSNMFYEHLNNSKYSYNDKKREYKKLINFLKYCNLEISNKNENLKNLINYNSKLQRIFYHITLKTYYYKNIINKTKNINEIKNIIYCFYIELNSMLSFYNNNNVKDRFFNMLLIYVFSQNNYFFKKTTDYNYIKNTSYDIRFIFTFISNNLNLNNNNHTLFSFDVKIIQFILDSKEIEKEENFDNIFKDIKKNIKLKKEIFDIINRNINQLDQKEIQILLKKYSEMTIEEIESYLNTKE